MSTPESPSSTEPYDDGSSPVPARGNRMDDQHVGTSVDATAGLVARRQSELLAFIAVIVVALVALGTAPYVAVSTAFAAGAAAIELRRRGDGR